MNGSDVLNFEACFVALTGHRPMRWQRRLFERLVDNDLPQTCDIPTGLGKTSVIPIWLIALALQNRESCKLLLPRRLLYIINRRTVVDQATQVVETMRLRLQNPKGEGWVDHQKTLIALGEKLQALACRTNREVLGISTLRGELADNEEWKEDPARPAIVVGTIDMIGSKLLFSGYGDGRYGRAHHAGLVGQDVLIVHDEAHLTPAFSDLLRAVAEEQNRECQRADGQSTIVRPARVIELSATSRESRGTSFTLEPEDEREQIVQERLVASKRLYVHSVSPDKVTEKILKLAITHEGARSKVLIYVRSPEQAQKIASSLVKTLGTGGNERVGTLTGTIRGHERDQLMRQPPESTASCIIRHFLDGTVPERSVYLISTAAGEVGIDLDADHMVCDLTTLDAMIQRLGRVNRRGGKDRRAHVHVVGDAPAGDKLSELDKAIAATFGILKRWERQQTDGIDVSPGNLRRLIGTLGAEERAAALAPAPAAPPLTDVLLDGWSLTSVPKMPGVPEVAAFLHGLTKEVPETFVAWRREVTLLAEAQVTDAELGDWFRACRVESRERLRDQTERVRGALRNLLQNHLETKENADFPVIVLDERGGARQAKLSQVVEKDFSLAFRTVVLPVSAGGLNEMGLLDPKDPKAVLPPAVVAIDVAEAGAGQRQRWVFRRSADVEWYERLDTGESRDGPPPGLREKLRISLKQPEGEEKVGLVDLVLFVSPPRSALEDPETASALQTLEVHSAAIAKQMSAIAKKLGLPEAIQGALVAAARWHDKGKDRPVWQRFACNNKGAEILAKSEKYLHPRALGGYRHEFGSLLDAMADANIQKHPERDLVLHLIAAHHGWARPHFEPRSFDNTRTTAENEKTAVEVMRRFGRLQQRFGRWGLAWLESLVRSADIAASKAAADEGVPGHEGQEALA